MRAKKGFSSILLQQKNNTGSQTLANDSGDGASKNDSNSACDRNERIVVTA
jgi:hypothetical protein